MIDTTHLILLHQIIIHVNRIFLSQSAYPQPRVVYSTSKRPSYKFIFSHCLNYILTYGKKLPKYARDKYFNRIRTLLLQQYTATGNRVKDSNRNNIRTKTFFRFSFKKIIFYFGIYFPCHCGLPVPFVMSNNRFACHLHHKSLEIYIKVLSTEQLILRRQRVKKRLDSRFRLDEPHMKKIVSQVLTSWSFFFETFILV